VSRKTTYLITILSILVASAAWIQPAPGDLIPPPATGDPAAPAEPIPAPGETVFPPPASAAEDAYVPASPAEQQQLLRRLREVVACARGRGAHVPDPIAVDVGAQIPWRDGEPDEATSRTVEGCFDPETVGGD
jgi:hypothetical protein